MKCQIVLIKISIVENKFMFTVLNKNNLRVLQTKYAITFILELKILQNCFINVALTKTQTPLGLSLIKTHVIH